MNRVQSRPSSRSRNVTNLTVKGFPDAALKLMRKRIKELEPTRGKLSYGKYLAECVFREAGEKKRPNGDIPLMVELPA